ncbi:unnamed protein product [Kuraishia capsulata CBS 1993]|uniref:Rab-GAP TBC domain-containing protein n=1 Tax=Kuraishia capsulata CBS 1993 TaxID=1382522 RepID=W6MRW6_9ASCO|nr:uncharacterized protein KUCA_T00005110001 [Kuraishia capsulata CBS 1993]CDK29123.1 unnamed protein product [Kuraishia capsulata CBS 1993]
MTDSLVPRRSANNPFKFPAGKSQLLFAKSKVYIHPTKSSKDNIPGYLTITRPFKDCSNSDLLVAFLPEEGLNKDDKSTLDWFDLYGLHGEDEGLLRPRRIAGTEVTESRLDSSNEPVKKVFINRPPLSSLMTYAFGVSISNMFSIQVRPKADGMWWGSIVIHTSAGEKVPVLFFHDDESPGTMREEKLRRQNFEPFATNSSSTGNSVVFYWGGDSFVTVLKNFCVLEESTLERGVLLVNPTSEDLRNFIPQNVADAKVKDPFKQASQNFESFITDAKWKILGGLASVTKLARRKVHDVKSDIPEPILKLLSKPEVKAIGDEFDSANVFLAKWALQLQEQAEQTRKVVILDDAYRKLIQEELGESLTSLTPQELSKATRRKAVSKVEWDSFFDHTGSLLITVDEVKERVFHGCLEDKEVRKEAWLFLLGVYPWDTSRHERKMLDQTFLSTYNGFKEIWTTDLKRQQEDEFWKDQKFRIEKDIKRTDRDISIYKGNGPASEERTTPDSTEDGATAPETTNDDDDDSDVSIIRNPHLDILRSILISYNELNTNLGYVQGMTDLLSPIYFVLEDESLAFWGFSRFMERMERNFVRDLSGMKNQMEVLNELVQFMLPDLYIHLVKCESNNLFFFFRMLLVWFKRELSYEDTMRLWEVLWTDYYSSQFFLFCALAVLDQHSRIMINNLHAFDEVLKYMNDISGHINLEQILLRAELLFLKFRNMVAIVERENAHEGIHGLQNSNGEGLTPVSPQLRKLLSRELVIQKEVPRPAGVGGG